LEISNRDNAIKFELHLIKKTRELFGFKKMIRFLIGLPTVIFTKRNRSAYEIMGPCKMIINNMPVLWQHPDVGFIDELILEKCYFPDHTFEIKDDYVVIDAGSNIGTFSIFSACYCPNGKVISVEADKYDYKRLVENIEANSFSNIETLNMALTEKTGEVFFSDCSVRDDTLSDNKKQPYFYSGKCESITLQDIIKKFDLKKIDFLKLDIEGSEFKIFDDVEWLNLVKIISMEVHAEPNDKKTLYLKKILEENNFLVQIIVNGGTTYCYAKKR
jgi:FkbM family methyltransferase